MSTSRKLGYGLIVGALSISIASAYAGWDPVGDAKKAGEKAKDVVQSVTPEVTVHPPTLTRAPSAEIKTGPVTTEVTADPTKPVHKSEMEGNSDAARIYNETNKVLRTPQELPGKAANMVEQEAKKALDKFVADFKAKFWALFEDLKKEAKPYLIMAVGIVLAILMIPALISSLLTVLIVRWMDRRRGRKEKQLALKAANVKTHPRLAA